MRPKQEDGADLDERYWLTHGVARTAGVSLQDAITRGELDREALAHMVVRCTQCTGTDRCILHLADPAAGSAGDIPEYCLNRESLEALKWRR